MKETVILTHKYLPEAEARLREKYRLILVEGSGLTLAETMEGNRECRALISFLSEKVDRDMIDLGESLKIIANYAVGYNNIDFAYAMSKGIYVTHTPDVLTQATADLTLALILACARRIVEADEFLRQGKFTGWQAALMLGKELNGSTLGIIGMGRIGLATALRARGFGLKIIYYSKPRLPEIEEQYGFVYSEFSELVKQADIVSLHIPYSPDMHHLFNREVFDLMKRDAIFINAARGPLMDEAVLAEKLEKNELFSAGLDVYESEPQVTEKLKKLKNAVLVPHIGSATHYARLQMAMMTIRSVEQALSGQTPAFLIPDWRQ